MATNARGTHSAPGIYTREIEIPRKKQSVKGTTLGVVGETLKGRAFQTVSVNGWEDFKKKFGGLSAAKFKDTKYPKYELPYIANEYLKESDSLEVVRVLGLCGYNAGPAWLIMGAGDSCDSVVAVIRSRGFYKKYFKYTNATSSGSCDCQYQVYDKLVYKVGERQATDDCLHPTSYDMSMLGLTDYQGLETFGNECEGYHVKVKGGASAISKKSCDDDSAFSVGYSQNDGTFADTSDFEVNGTNNGRFRITGTTYDGKEFGYNVSLNPGDKEYILSVLGTDPLEGEAPVFVESLYDVALTQAIANGSVQAIRRELGEVNVFYPYNFSNLRGVAGKIEMAEGGLVKSMIGNRYVAEVNDNINAGGGNVDMLGEVYVHPYDYGMNKPLVVENISVSGEPVYQVKVSYEPEGNIGVAAEELFEFDSDLNLVSGNVQKVFGEGVDTIVVDSNKTIMHKSVPGQIYTVRQFTKNGKRNYFYGYYPESNVKAHTDVTSGDSGIKYATDVITEVDRLVDIRMNGDYTGYTCIDYAHGTDEKPLDPRDTECNWLKAGCVRNLTDGYYYRMYDGKFEKVSMDLNDYRSQYSHAITPWIVSNAKGDVDIELSRMFRFHTLSDGAASNNEVKVSIANIRPDDGTFDVLVRDIYDSDSAPVILEKYSRCSMVPGDRNYIGYLIGTNDGIYESKSNYISVEIMESDVNQMSVPCGFIGYPTNVYEGLPIIGDRVTDRNAPDVTYNRYYDPAMKAKKQYFGISEIEGVDSDYFTFKGRNAYNEEDPTYLGNGFHLDSRLGVEVEQEDGSLKTYDVYVDGKPGYRFDSVDSNNRTAELTGMPIIASETDMEECIYSDVNVRKFTVYFYGGFDGWNPYRGQRTTTDEFTRANYKGTISVRNGEGINFGYIQDNSKLKLTGTSINSDYYAFLAGYRKFSNPNAIDIDILATPGIDYVKDTLLTKEVIEIVEEERGGDCIYAATTPDKPAGAGDTEEEMFTADDAVDNLAETEIDTNYACTYYPWVKYKDNANNQYIFLPATKDAVRDMAFTDKKTYPWYAPAGENRGPVNCVAARTTLLNGEMDELYDGMINPIATFDKQAYIWGQKTMTDSLEDDSKLLSRIHVRRMMIRLKKDMVRACRGLLFDPDDDIMASDIRKRTNPILENMAKNRGIQRDYYIEIDTSAEAHARRECPVKVFVKPINMTEYIPIDFILTPEDMSFDEI